jgi:hypothetical protein
VSEVAAVWWPGAVLDRSRWAEAVTPLLDRVVAARDRDRFPHALLLVGPPGLGRELAAVEAAVMLCCEGASEPWSVSSSAERVRRGVHPDVRAVLAEGKAKRIKIDQIRAVADETAARPYEGLRRVWIIDGVESSGLGPEAANAFLKTLEEPPEHAVFILLAANPTAVLPTIRSRCQQLSLPVPDAPREGIPPALAGAQLAGVDLDAVLTAVAGALETTSRGEPRQLLRLPYVLGDDVDAFEVVAAVATETAAASSGTDGGEGLARLAADLLATNRRCRALNLDRGRQLISCLMRWFRDDVGRQP